MTVDYSYSAPPTCDGILVREMIKCVETMGKNISTGIHNLEETAKEMCIDDVCDFIQPIVIDSLINRCESLIAKLGEIEVEASKK